MSRSSTLFGRLLLLCALALGFGAVSGAVACVPPPVASAAMASMLCHGSNEHRASGQADHCGLLCSAVAPAHAPALPKRIAETIVHPIVAGVATSRAIAPEPPPPRTL